MFQVEFSIGIIRKGLRGLNDVQYLMDDIIYTYTSSIDGEFKNSQAEGGRMQDVMKHITFRILSVQMNN